MTILSETFTFVLNSSVFSAVAVDNGVLYYPDEVGGRIYIYKATDPRGPTRVIQLHGTKPGIGIVIGPNVVDGRSLMY